MTDWMRHLILGTGGHVDDIFVLKPGCILIAATELTEDAFDILKDLNIASSPMASSYEGLAELNARLTYLSFNEEPPIPDSDSYLWRMAREHQHLSVFGSSYATFLLAGIALETSMELIAHGEAKAARVTSSKTKAMDTPLYRILGDPDDRAHQMAMIRRVLVARKEEPEFARKREFVNLNNVGSKATALTYTMSIKHFHSLFIGRLHEAGNETEVQEICGMMCKILHEEYPLVIREPAEYMKMGNGAKYAGT